MHSSNLHSANSWPDRQQRERVRVVIRFLCLNPPGRSRFAKFCRSPSQNFWSLEDVESQSSIVLVRSRLRLRLRIKLGISYFALSEIVLSKMPPYEHQSKVSASAILPDPRNNEKKYPTMEQWPGHGCSLYTQYTLKNCLFLVYSSNIWINVSQATAWDRSSSEQPKANLPNRSAALIPRTAAMHHRTSGRPPGSGQQSPESGRSRLQCLPA